MHVKIWYLNDIMDVNANCLIQLREITYSELVQDGSTKFIVNYRSYPRQKAVKQRED